MRTVHHLCLVPMTTYQTNSRLRLGILESDIVERPMSHNFVTSKANLEGLDASLPHYEGFEQSRAK